MLKPGYIRAIPIRVRAILIRVRAILIRVRAILIGIDDIHDIGDIDDIDDIRDIISNSQIARERVRIMVFSISIPFSVRENVSSVLMYHLLLRVVILSA